MARDFVEVVDKIKEVAPEHLIDALDNACYWAPEAAWYELSECVNMCIEPSSKDEVAVAVYALLCDCTEAEMKARFEADGL